MVLLGLIGKEVLEVLALKVGYGFVSGLDSEVPDNGGRVRVHVPGLRCSPVCAKCIEESLSQRPGILKVKANHVTGNALVFYDPTVWDAEGIKTLLKKEGPSA
ncbi:MAG: cation transporter [Euryarchaeota archaeon]|nr:cation transporter [Euryarchaeota archaeon]